MYARWGIAHEWARQSKQIQDGSMWTNVDTYWVCFVLSQKPIKKTREWRKYIMSLGYTLQDKKKHVCEECYDTVSQH